MLQDDKWLCCPVASGVRRRLPFVQLLLSVVHHSYSKALTEDPKSKTIFKKITPSVKEDNLNFLEIAKQVTISSVRNLTEKMFKSHYTTSVTELD